MSADDDRHQTNNTSIGHFLVNQMNQKIQLKDYTFKKLGVLTVLYISSQKG